MKILQYIVYMAFSFLIIAIIFSYIVDNPAQEKSKKIYLYKLADSCYIKASEISSGHIEYVPDSIITMNGAKIKMVDCLAWDSMGTAKNSSKRYGKLKGIEK